MLLWSVREAAQQLGGVSTRTVSRMIERGELPVVRVGRLLRVPADAVRSWVTENTRQAHNPQYAEPEAWKGSKPCHTNAKIVPFGGCLTPTQAAKELDVLLAPQTARKRRR